MYHTPRNPINHTCYTLQYTHKHKLHTTHASYTPPTSRLCSLLRSAASGFSRGGYHHLGCRRRRLLYILTHLRARAFACFPPSPLSLALHSLAAWRALSANHGLIGDRTARPTGPACCGAMEPNVYGSRADHHQHHHHQHPHNLMENGLGTEWTCRLCSRRCTGDTRHWGLFEEAELAQKLMAFAAVQVRARRRRRSARRVLSFFTFIFVGYMYMCIYASVECALYSSGFCLRLCACLCV